MTPKVLASTDHELLSSLLLNCRQFEQDLLDPTELWPEPDDVPEPRSGWWLVLGFLVGSFVVALAWMSWAW